MRTLVESKLKHAVGTASQHQDWSLKLNSFLLQSVFFTNTHSRYGSVVIFDHRISDGLLESLKFRKQCKRLRALEGRHLSKLMEGTKENNILTKEGS